MRQAFPIGDLAKATGTKVETIRYYERIGLLPAPARTRANYRAYSDQHMERLSFIRRARALGFSLDQVRRLLALAGDKEGPCEGVDAIARQHLGEVDAKLANLTALRDALSHLIAQCHSETIVKCRIIEALSPRNRTGM